MKSGRRYPLINSLLRKQPEPRRGHVGICAVIACVKPAARIQLYFDLSENQPFRIICVCQDHRFWKEHFIQSIGPCQYDFSFEEYEVYKMMNE